MARLTPSLSLTMDYSSVGTTTGSLIVSVDDTLTVTSPLTNLSSKVVATGAASELIPTNSATSYIYIKAVSEAADSSSFLQVKIGSHAVIRLDVGEFLFTPIYNGYAVNCESYNSAVTVEYGSWTKG
tara:strand:- start:9876 stop:10256 length:381 start_codon:yes stop_codon:yes gene_type:complete